MFVTLLFSLAVTLFASSPAIDGTYEDMNALYSSKIRTEALAKDRLKIATINLGLLKTKMFSVPNFEQRLNLLEFQLGSFLSLESPDFVFLQEAWHTEEYDILGKINSIAKAHDYFSISDIYNKRNNEDQNQFINHGLNILIKRSSTFISSGVMETGFRSIPRTGLEYLAGIEKGVLFARVYLNSNINVFIATSHFTPNLIPILNTQNWERRKQTLATAQILKDKASSSDLVIFGADLNLSPEFEYKINDGRRTDTHDYQWIENSENYSLFFEETQMIDTYYIANPGSKGYTQDRLLNPMANLGPSTDGEPEQRLDYIWMKTDHGIFFTVESSNLIFDQPLIDSNGQVILGEDEGYFNHPLYMSDRFGVMSEVLIY